MVNTRGKLAKQNDFSFLDGMVHWEEKKTSQDTENVAYYYKARSTDIEQTSYVLLAKLAKDGREGINSAVSIVKWLAKQRNSLGGWSSTQVCCFVFS